MTGLEIELRKAGGVRRQAVNNIKSYSGLARLLGYSYGRVKRGVEQNIFSVEESLLILKILFPEYGEDFNFYKYLFENQEI